MRLPVWARVLIVIGACALAGLPMLGDRGLTNSEGHRVVPAMEILHGGDLWATTMFETVYVRKPPGMFWAIAASSAVLGETEFAARLVSVLAVTAMSVVSLLICSRWFGAAGGLASALATGLMPAILSSTRSAEIEALNTCFTAIAALLLIDGAARLGSSSVKKRAVWGVLAGVSCIAMVMTKGPAGLPIVLGAWVAGALIQKSAKALLSPTSVAFVLTTLVLGGGFVLVWTGAIASSPEPRVIQSPSAFMFEPGRIGKIAALLPTAFAFALPGSLAMLFPWEAKRLNESQDNNAKLAVRACLTLTIAWLIALVVFTISGVSNPRYAQPAAPLAAACAGYLVWGVRHRVFAISRRRIGARLCVLGHPAAWLLVMGGFIVGYLLVEEPSRAAESGRDVGRELGQLIASDGMTGDVTIWSDWAIEARPEVLLEAEREAQRLGTNVHTRWAYRWDPRTIEGIENGGYVVLRDDSPNPAFQELTTELDLSLTRLGEGRVKHFEFGLYRIEPVPERGR